MGFDPVKRVNICLSFLTVFLLLAPVARANDALTDAVCSPDNLNIITASDIGALPGDSIPLPKAPLSTQAPLVITVPGLRFDTIKWGPLTYELFSEMAKYWINGLKKPGAKSAESEEVIKAAYAKYAEQFEPFQEAAAHLPEPELTRSEPDNYLEARLAQAPVCSRLTVAPFPWSRNPADTAATVARFVPQLIRAYDSNRGSARPVYILAHSWGTVLMHEALTQVAVQRPDIKIDKFFTLGSPLTPGNFLVKAFNGVQQNAVGVDKPVNRPANVRYWRNVWAAHDYFSNAIKAADVNVQVDASVGAPENELAKFLLHSWHVVQAKTDFITLLNVRNWHSSYYKDFDAYLQTLDRHIHLVVFDPEVAAPLVSSVAK